jgi:hypothetical protein
MLSMVRRRLQLEQDLKSYLNKKQIAEIREKFSAIDGMTDQLVLRYVAHPFKNEQAREYARHGFARRLGTLRRCIQNVFRIVPPGTTRVPVKTKLNDAQINLQAFVANVYGSIDNLAWVWVHERGLTDQISRGRVGFRPHHTEVRSALSQEFQSYLHGLDGWLAYIIEYRDSLGHRIPLYIPPGGVRPKDIGQYNELMDAITGALNRLDPREYDRLSAEQNKLLIFQPLMTHSVNEATAHFAFHVQMIADFLTVEELGRKMLLELSRIT